MNRERYQHQDSSRVFKTQLVKKIISTVRASEGRFLKFDERSSSWLDVGEECAYEKVSHALRYRPNSTIAGAPKKPRSRQKKGYEYAYDSEVYLALLAIQRKIFQELLLEDTNRTNRSKRSKNTTWKMARSA